MPAVRLDSATCTTHGKLLYRNRKTARKQAKRAQPGAHLSAYRCDDTGLFHLGNLPDRIRSGAVGREVITNKLITQRKATR